MGELERSSWSKSSPRSGTCTRGSTRPRSLGVCRSAERVGELRLAASGGDVGVRTGRESRVRSDGCLCSRPVTELSDERARLKRERSRAGGGSGWWSGGGSGRASCQPRCEDRRREKRAAVLGRACSGVREWASVVVSLSWRVPEGEASRPGAHDRGRRRRRAWASEAPRECACPIVRGHRGRWRRPRGVGVAEGG